MPVRASVQKYAVSLLIIMAFVSVIPNKSQAGQVGAGLGNDVVTISNGAIVGKDIVDQSLDLCPACFQDLIKKWVPVVVIEVEIKGVEVLECGQGVHVQIKVHVLEDKIQPHLL